MSDVKLPISFCTFVKNEERNIKDLLESVKPFVSEIIVTDTGSEDRTVEIASGYTDRVYKIEFSDFGSVRTLTAHLASYPWVLMLDADERLLASDWENVKTLIKQPEGSQGDNNELDGEGNVVIDSWAIPRKRWADKWMLKQVDVESYPDWQVRLFRNHWNRPLIKFVRRVHERISGCIRTEKVTEGVTIHHFQNVHKSKSNLAARQELYQRLYDLDIKDNVEHSEPPVVLIDKV